MDLPLQHNDNNNKLSLTESILLGEIRSVIFESDEGFSIIKIRTHQGVEHIIKGPITGAFEGQNIEVTGSWENHKEYGKQFKVKQFKFTLPTTKRGIKRYLASGLIQGIGKKTADQIVDKFGIKTIEIIDRFSVRLLEIPGFGKKRLTKVKKAWKEQESKRQLYLFLHGLGITSAYCERIYKTYGDNASNIIKANPYQLASEVDGIGFKMSDGYAKYLGIEQNDIKRILSGIKYALDELMHSGHICYPKDKFIEYTQELLNVEIEGIEAGLSTAIKRDIVKTESFTNRDGELVPMIYASSMYNAEKELANLVEVLSKQNHNKGGQYLNVPLDSKIDFSSEQLIAIERIGQYPLNIITGGPGVGKTTVIGEIVRKAQVADMKILLAAPTGRAAKRLSESTRRHAMTIHRLLKWDAEERVFVFGRNRPLKCDMLIVDEVSMLDISLAVHLFRAVSMGTIVILVGDSDQLPSVGPGRVLKDLILSKRFAVTHLSKIYRQKAKSKIIINAHSVNAGKIPALPEKGDTSSDFYWIEQDNPEKTLELIKVLIKDRIPKKFKFNPYTDIQILTPMNKGLCGTKSINEHIQKLLNGGNKPQFKYGETTFKINDKVMQTSNNYELKVFNGDIGRIVKINSEEKTFSVNYDGSTVQYEFVDAKQIVHSYAITIHKSQGSEFPVVIMPMLTQHYVMLQKNLLYTGMTRAKKLLIIVGSKKALSIAVNNFRLEPRYSMFLQRLKK